MASRACGIVQLNKAAIPDSAFMPSTVSDVPLTDACIVMSYETARSIVAMLFTCDALPSSKRITFPGTLCWLKC